MDLSPKRAALPPCQHYGKNLNIPALVGATGILELVQEGDQLILDAGSGQIYINPAPEFAEKFKCRQKQLDSENERWLANADQPVVTQDGRKLKVYSNVGNIKDVEQAVKLHVEGVGLFRSEFLYMESDHFPTEDEQFEVYKKQWKPWAMKWSSVRWTSGVTRNYVIISFVRRKIRFLDCGRFGFASASP